jgi:inhibitor of KinA
MHLHDAPYRIFSIGDAAITLDLGNVIDPALNRKVLAIREQILQQPFTGLLDCRIAYSSVTLVYDPVAVKKAHHPENTVFAFLQQYLEAAYHKAQALPDTATRTVRIPVCYEDGYGVDLEAAAAQLKLSPEKLITLHLSRSYRVYMIGFLPGFAYMGLTHEQLYIPRKAQPVPVKAGSVGITGRQTGIYPLHCPGGWYIIGRTPQPLFDACAEIPVLLQPGDEVQFYRISGKEFESLNRNG